MVFDYIFDYHKVQMIKVVVLLWQKHSRTAIFGVCRKPPISKISTGFVMLAVH